MKCAMQAMAVFGRFGVAAGLVLASGLGATSRAQQAEPAATTGTGASGDQSSASIDPVKPVEVNQPRQQLDALKVAPELANFTVRSGYVVELAVPRLDNARFLEVSPDGWLYVSRPRVGDIVALQDEDGDGVYDRSFQFVDQLPFVHGMCWHDGALWFATSGSIFKAEDTDNNGVANVVSEVLSNLPSGGQHWWRSVLVTDDAIYTSIGDSANINDEEATERQKIWRFNLSGSDKTLWSSGVRNTEKLRLRPGTQEIWGIDHGSDSMGQELGETAESYPFTDHNPPDEINLYEQGKFYGHPFVTGNMWPRPEHASKEDIVAIGARTVAPRWKIPAHWAGNGFTFIDPAVSAAARDAATQPGALPRDHDGDMFFAARGSWNRSVRAGYQIARVLFDKDPQFEALAQGGKPVGMMTIVSTLQLQTDGQHRVLARPVDVVQARDGTVLFSSDQPVGRVYRIRWVGDKAE